MENGKRDFRKATIKMILNAANEEIVYFDEISIIDLIGARDSQTLVANEITKLIEENLLGVGQEADPGFRTLSLTSAQRSELSLMIGAAPAPKPLVPKALGLAL